MFKTQYLITLLLFSFNFGEAQSSMPSNFIPEGYVESETYFGDLNNDKIDDCVLVIKETNTSAIVTNRFGNKVDRNRRGIIVLFKYKNGYQLASKNSSCFYSENEDGGNYYPPESANRFFDTLTIQKGLSKILIDVPTAVLQIIFALILLSFYPCQSIQD